MKRRHWSYPSCELILLVAVVFMLLVVRCSLRHSGNGEKTASLAGAAAPDGGAGRSGDVDERLMELAAVDPAASAVLQAAKKLLEGNLARAPGEHRDVALRGLREWVEKQRFDPGVMSELVGLVKRPIDRYHGGTDDDGSEGRRYASCSVVGNSGILLASEHGKLIDGHELVIRLNNAPAGNGLYARHVGTRTGLAFLNSNVLSQCTAARRSICFCRAYGEGVPILTYMCNAAHFVEHAVCNANSSSFLGAGFVSAAAAAAAIAAPVIVTDPRLDALCARLVKYYSLRRFARETGRPAEEWSQQNDEGMFHYSSGMQAVVAAAGVCDRVSVFGFGKDAAARHHYHTLQRRELDLHDYEAEYEFYRDLESRPEAIPFLHDSGFQLPPVTLYR
ncbi:hypothetical protein GUJ93_ZPchr0014g47354 [Zizania palustris]|uniref:Sialyltransferase-like protein 3 n=1 Tax=Zizania palustris TaxID=103762 RepID=A0A8J5TFJ7_ZIZPA|nr:hypothetical protein GUJ93_ZPchr0014g47354 [Zizania palustris]